MRTHPSRTYERPRLATLAGECARKSVGAEGEFATSFMWGGYLERFSTGRYWAARRLPPTSMILQATCRATQGVASFKREQRASTSTTQACSIPGNADQPARFVSIAAVLLREEGVEHRG